MELEKQRVTEEEESQNDRISELHDSLLIQILSLLPTEDAFRTCLISKRWQTLSTLIDSFNFTCSYYRAREDFTFVHNALAHSLSSKIKNFQLDFTSLCLSVCSLKPEYESLVSRSFSFAVERNVENVVLFFYYGDKCTLPESLYTCSSLITLDLQSCGFNNAVISWSSLKSIKLGFLVLTDDEIVKLLSGCPALETLELYMYEGFRRLEIMSPNLKTLKLKDYQQFSENGDDLEILAPYLLHLEISGDLYDLKLRLVDVSSLVNVKLIFDIACFNVEDSCRDYHKVIYSLVQDNLQKLCHANELTIGSWFTEVMCMLQFKWLPVSELNCKYLTLVLHMKKFNLYGVAGLLRASAHVETLNTDMETTVLDNFSHIFDNSRCNFELLDLAKGDNIYFQNGVSRVEFQSLKKVKLVISSDLCLKNHVKWGFNKLFKLSKFLLMNASASFGEVRYHVK